MLEIKLLGNVNITLNGRSLNKFISRKADALLIYLVCHKRPFSREHLATLFWGDSPQKKALANLSVILSSLRKQLDDYIIADRQNVAFKHAGDLFLDVNIFVKGIEAARRQSNKPLTRSTAAQLNRAVAQYQGSFLSGFKIRNAIDFEAWALVEQEHLSQMASEAFGALVDFHLERKNYACGIAFAQQLIALDPLLEEAHQQLMRLYALDGQRSAALVQYEKCVQILATELGVDPEEATTTLYTQIQANELLAAAATTTILNPTQATVPAHNLPTAMTPFVGRGRELSTINAHLDNPDCHLLTLLGIGGMGKTRLALEATAAQIGKFCDGVWFVPLAGVADSTLLIAAIADAIGYSFPERGAADQQLIDFLRPKEMLLLLDNFEHLIEGADFLGELLPQAPEVRLLVTSRERLNLQAEWLQELVGLPYPATVTESFADFSAVQLFVNSVRRLQQDFMLSPQNSADVLAICQRVNGMPLGIELAATLVRVMPLNAITIAIQENQDSLATRSRDLPPRHHSLRAVFDSSWQRLPASEKRLLAQLAAFRGSFGYTAVTTITKATLNDISSLLDKSLLQQPTPGRYELHAMLRQFIVEAWRDIIAREPELWQQMRAAHGRFYLGFLAQKEPDLSSGKDPATLRAVQIEMDNIRRAWQWSVRHNQWQLLVNSCDGLARYYVRQGLIDEGVDMLETAVAACQVCLEETAVIDQTTTQQLKTLQAKLRLGQGRLTLAHFSSTQAEVYLRAALALLPDSGAEEIKAPAYLFLGRTQWYYGAYDESFSTSQIAVTLAQQTGQGVVEANALRLLGMAKVVQNDNDAATVYYQQALTILNKIDHPLSKSDLLINLSVQAMRLARYEIGRDYGLEALALKRQIQDRLGEAMVLSNLGIAEERLGNYDQGRDYYLESLHIRQTLGARHSQIHVLNNLGHSASVRGQITDELIYNQQSCQIADETGNREPLAIALSNCAGALIKLGRFDAAQKDVEQAITLTRTLQRADVLSLALATKSFLLRRLGKLDAALKVSAEAVIEAEAGGDVEYIHVSRLYRAQALAAVNHPQAAAELFHEDLTFLTDAGRGATAVEAHIGLARLAWAAKDLTDAQKHAEAIWNFYQTNPFGGVDDPAELGLTCYHIFTANNDPRAQKILQLAHAWLERETAVISSIRNKRKFLENIPANQEIA